MIKKAGLTACALVLSFATAFADCASLGRQAKQDDGLLGAAMEEYKRVASTLPKGVSPTPDRLSHAISANTKLIEAFDRSIASLERGKNEGCFKNQAAAWNQILADLKAKRAEFNIERQTLLKTVAVLQPANAGASIPKAEWKSFLAPSLKTFTVCVVQTKRRALAVKDKRPSPQDFALIMRGACNTEATAIDAEQNKIQNWTPQDRSELKQALDSVRARAISEYSASLYGMR